MPRVWRPTPAPGALRWTALFPYPRVPNQRVGLQPGDSRTKYCVVGAPRLGNIHVVHGNCAVAEPDEVAALANDPLVARYPRREDLHAQAVVQAQSDLLGFDN